MALWIIELLLHTVSFICGLVSAALVASVQVRNHGVCLLYGSLHYNSSVGLISVDSSSDPSLCCFVIAIPAATCIFSFLHILTGVCSCCTCHDVRGRPCRVMTGVMCGLLFLFLLITGCVLKIGTDQLCHSLPPPHFNRCEDAQNVDWTVPNNGYHFYNHLHSAELCVWVGLCCMLVSGVLVCTARGDGVGMGGPSSSSVGRSAKRGGRAPGVHRSGGRKGQRRRRGGRGGRGRRGRRGTNSFDWATHIDLFDIYDVTL